MCGRFTQAYTWEQLVRFYRLTMPAVNTQPSYNVCWTDQIDVILPAAKGSHEFARMRWGSAPILVVEATRTDAGNLLQQR